MPEPTIPPSPPTAPPTTVKKKRATQDQALANFITTESTRLQAATENPNLAPHLTRRGISPTVLASGIALGAALQDSFTERQRKQEADDNGLHAIAETRKIAREIFSLYRDTVRLAYPGSPSARAALGATGRFPQDDDTFLSAATAAYAIAGDSAHAATLAAVGFGASEHAAAVSTLTDFAAVRAAYPAVHAAMLQATAQRDRAATAFKTWMTTYNRAVRLISREHPELAVRL